MKKAKNPYETENSFDEKTIIVVFFIVLLIVIAFFVFFKSDITGKVVRADFFSNDSLDFEADLSIPSLELKDSFEEVRLSGISGANFKIEDVGAGLLNFENEIVLENFEGEISFGSDRIEILEGKAEKVFINGNPFYIEDDKIEVEISKSVSYDSLTLSDVYLKKLDYVASGSMDVEDNIFNLDNERVLIKDFYGKLGVSGTAIFEGSVTSLEVKGDSQVSIS